MLLAFATNSKKNLTKNKHFYLLLAHLAQLQQISPFLINRKEITMKMYILVFNEGDLHSVSPVHFNYHNLLTWSAATIKLMYDTLVYTEYKVPLNSTQPLK